MFVQTTCIIDTNSTYCKTYNVHPYINVIYPLENLLNQKHINLKIINSYTSTSSKDVCINKIETSNFPRDEPNEKRALLSCGNIHRNIRTSGIRRSHIEETEMIRDLSDQRSVYSCSCENIQHIYI